MLQVVNQVLTAGGRSYRCAIGKGGFSSDKKEGDGCTPLGVFALRECWYRADRIGAPETGLPLRIIHEQDGWCDDPASADYNRHVPLFSCHSRESGNPTLKMVSPAKPEDGGRDYSFERLHRDDPVYDVIVPLGYNDDPIVPGKGSAIFMHVAKPDYAPTEGCVALALPDMLEVLKTCDAQTRIAILGES